jgi:hypothetical protein
LDSHCAFLAVCKVSIPLGISLEPILIQHRYFGRIDRYQLVLVVLVTEKSRAPL